MSLVEDWIPAGWQVQTLFGPVSDRNGRRLRRLLPYGWIPFFNGMTIPIASGGAPKRGWIPFFNGMTTALVPCVRRDDGVRGGRVLTKNLFEEFEDLG